MTGTKSISIILPSYNDNRIEYAIKSIRRFDDANIVKIIVVDGGSNDDTVHLIQGLMQKDDFLISEPDKGIFDALNKGLEHCDSDFIGWLGADDLFTNELTASMVEELLGGCDLLVANLKFFHDGYVTRLTHSVPSGLGFMKFGLHNPHYATFGRASLLKSERFRLDLRGSDIEYFLRIFSKKPRVRTISAVSTLQGEGGYSNSNGLNIFRTNIELLSIFAEYTNWFIAPLAIFIKLSYKLASRLYYFAFKTAVHDSLLD